MGNIVIVHSKLRFRAYFIFTLFQERTNYDIIDGYYLNNRLCLEKEIGHLTKNVQEEIVNSQFTISACWGGGVHELGSTALTLINQE